MTNGPKYKASVIVPTYNRSEVVCNTVRALSAQNLPKDQFEVIVVDDGSNDDTFTALTTLDPDLHLKYAYQPDRGYRLARARNLGIALAEGDVCIFVDAGNLPATQFVAEHLASHARIDDALIIGYSHGFISMHDDQRTEEAFRLLDPYDIDASVERFKAAGLADAREFVYQGLNDDLSRAAVPWAYVSGGNISVRREMAERIGRFDENYLSWGDEDVDFGVAVHLAGGTIAVNRNAGLIQTPHEKNREQRMASHRKNSRYLHSKYNLPETALFVKFGYRRMPLFREQIDPADYVLES